MSEDHFLATYVTECSEHLETVENDLLEMERLGTNSSSALVNRVFLAAHSIKGGAGFFELHSVKELAHKLENVLEMIRSGGLVPNLEVVNQLLQGFDKMKLLFSDIGSAGDADVGDEILALTGLASSYLPNDKKEQAIVMSRYPVPGSGLELQASELLIDSRRLAGDGIALLLFDLIHDVQRLGKQPFDLIKQVESQGVLLDCGIDILGVGTLDQDTVADKVPFYVLLATSQSLSQLTATFDIAPDKVRFVELPSADASVLVVHEYGALTRFIYQLTGIEPDERKVRVVEKCLSSLLETQGFGTYSELFYKARSDPELKKSVIGCLQS